MRLKTTAAVMTLALGLGSGAAAQERPAEFDNWVIPGWTFTPSISVSGVWDSNVAISSGEAGRGPASDRLFLIEPQGQVEFRSSRTEFVGGYKGYLRRYVSIGELNGFDQRGYVSFRHAVTRRLSVHAGNGFEESPTTDEVELNGVPFAWLGSRTNRLNAGADYRLSKLSDLQVRYENTWVSFEDQATFLRGGLMHGMSAKYTTRLTERTAVGGEYRFRHSTINDDTRNLSFHDVGGLLQQALSPHVRVTIAAGYSVIRDPLALGRRGGLYVRSELSRATEKMTTSVGYEHSYVPSFGFGGTTASRELRGYVHMPFSRNRFYVNGGGMWRRTDPLLPHEVELDTFSLDGTFGYGLSRWLRVQSFYRFTRQNSRNVTVDVLDGRGGITRHRIGAEIVLSQPMRLR